MKELLKLWDYRYYIVRSITNDFRTRFVRSRIGGAWMIMHPLAQVAMYALILSAVLTSKLTGIDSPYAYAIYLMAGMLAWSLFAEILTRTLTIFIDNGNLIKKMQFPHLALPLIAGGTALTNNILLFSAILIVFSLLGHPINPSIIWTPFLMLLTATLAMGIGITLGLLNVFIRDIGLVTPIIIHFWFWLTPIVYTINITPDHLQKWLYLNPMTGITQAYQDILVYGNNPKLNLMTNSFIFSILSVILAAFCYKKSHEDMADVL